MMPKMVLFVVSLLLAWMPTPTSGNIHDFTVSHPAPLQFHISWTDDIVQTYQLVVKDDTNNLRYYTTEVPGYEFLFDDAGKAQLKALRGGGPFVLYATNKYHVSIKGETDEVIAVWDLGYLQDMIGPPVQILCDKEDETSVDAIERVAPGGCQNPQVPGTVRLYYEDPLYTGFQNGDPVTILGWAFQWSKDATFTTNVFEDTCLTDPDATEALLVENGDTCNIDFYSAQIPRSGPMNGGTFFIRTAAIINFGTGTFSNATSVFMVTPTTQVTFTANLMMPSAAFTPELQNIYLQGVANTLKVSILDVSIGSIEAVDGGKIEVNTIAEVSVLYADAVESNGGWQSRDNWHTICGGGNSTT